MKTLLSSLLAASLVGYSCGDFLETADKLYNDPKELKQMYLQHKKAHAVQQKSELDGLLEDMHQYVVDNEDSKAPKNILTIMTDDMGWKDIGYNDDTFVSPTSDFMADAGTRLDNFYVQCTCSPTRASMLTGRAVTATGLQDGAIIPGESRHLPSDIRIAPEYFKEAGYSTYLVGKWHLGQRYVSQTPNSRGYDYFFGVLGGAVDFYEKDIGLQCGSPENNNMAMFADNCVFLNAYDFQENGVPYVEEVDKYVTDILADKAVDSVISHDPSQPFFMNFHPTGPHTPLQTTTEMFEVCEGVSDGSDLMIQPYFRQQICGMVASVDLAMLRILLALASKRMLASTLVVFHSDNGGFEQAGSVNLPFRSQKGALFDGGVHVPAFMYGNGLHLGSALQPVRTDLMHVSDILPTLMGYAGVTAPSGSNFDGYNNWPQLTLGLPLRRSHIPLNSASKNVGYFSAYIQKIFGTTWKYMLNPSVITFAGTSNLGDTYEPEGEFLFNLSEDPSESTNLINDSSLKTIAILNLLRARTLLLQATSAPSQLEVFPPVVDIPPSMLGCWLPLDSPYYATATCPVPPPIFPPVDMQTIFTDSEYNQYITSNLDL